MKKKNLALALSLLVLMACSPDPKTVYVDSKTGEAIAPPVPPAKDKSHLYVKVCLDNVLYWAARDGYHDALTPVIKLHLSRKSFTGVTC